MKFPFSILGVLAFVGVAHAEEPERRIEISGPAHVKLFVDRDDDDDDGIADIDAARVKGKAATNVAWLIGKKPFKLDSIDGDAVRLIAGDKPLSAAAPVGRSLAKLGLQGARAGASRVRLNGELIEAQVVDVVALDARGNGVDLAQSHASISRVLPRGLTPQSKVEADPDAVRWLLIGPAGALPIFVEVKSSRPGGEALDALGPLKLSPHACPAATSPDVECRATELIRATSDLVDRSHPQSAGRSLRAEVGGRLALSADGVQIASLRVGGPRKSALGKLGRYRGKLRVRLVRLAAGGSPPIGGDDASALAVAREEVRSASAIWGQCGIHFGTDQEIDVAIVDPPPAHFVAVGCDLGLPASGGRIAFRVGKQSVVVETKAGQTPTEVAANLAQVLRRSGFAAVISPNARIAPGALRTVDVLVRRADGALAALEPAEQGRLSSDATLDACLGEVDLSDGLTHFTDFDAIAGTVEERALLKAFDDGDPTTLEVFVVPSFARTGRIGESFIANDGSSVRNAVILDRAGIRAGARSYALAHELGHILLDMPGHPDDYGVDQPTLLMDADAADPTIFGPRRLSVPECERAITQSGPTALTPLLSEWPLIGTAKKTKR